jgi:hypothetical protein
MTKYIITLIIAISIIALIIRFQNSYSYKCKKLKSSAFNEAFNPTIINEKFEELSLSLDNITQEEFNNCNCADIIWSELLKDKRHFSGYFQYTTEGPSWFLRDLPTRIERMNLKTEFRLNSIHTLQDSFTYVVNRFISKQNKRCDYYNLYSCIEVESEFLRENRYRLQKEYFTYFDDTSHSVEIRDHILRSLFDSGKEIENEILKRISNYLQDDIFYRMLGILRTSGSDRSVQYLTMILENKVFNLKQKKLIIDAIIQIIERGKVNDSSKNRFNKLIKDSK